MKTRPVVLTLAMCFVCLTLCSAQDWMVGSWKLNEAKSKFIPGVANNLTVVYAVAGDKIKCTMDGLDGQGKPLHTEWTGKFDGEFYPLTGDPKGDMRAYKKINERGMQEITEKDGNVTGINRIVVFADGKSRSVITDLTDREGERMSNVAIYDKQ
jgi:hypothetical protein